MTSHPPSRPDPMHPDPRHPDDEALSASVDDQARPDVVDHITTCRECRARVAALGSARDTLGAAVAAPPPGLRERAVAAAGAAWTEARPEAPSAPRVDAPVVDLATRRRPGRLVALGAAAAAVLALVAVPALVDSDPPQETAAQDQSADESSRLGEKSAADPAGPMRAAGPETAAAELAESGGLGASAGPDLGEQDDVSDVARAVRSLTVAAGAAPSPAADAAAPRQSGAPQSGAPQPETLSAPVSANSACDGIVRARAATGEVGDLGLLVYSATLRYRGEPALALAYRRADPATAPRDEPADRTGSPTGGASPAPGDVLFIVASGDCRSLAVSNL